MFVLHDISEEVVRDAFQGQPPGTFYFISFEKKETAWSLAVRHEQEVRLHSITFSVIFFNRHRKKVYQ